MKKLTAKILIAGLVFLLCGAVVFAAGENILVSLGYLNSTYAGELIENLTGRTEPLDEVYEDGIGKLEEILGEDGEDLSWTTTAAFVMVYPLSGETVTLASGSGLLWQSGTGAASSMLLNLTTGEELAPASPLTAGHRYLAEQETVITAVSASACGVEGKWKTTATGKAPVELPFRDVKTGDWFYNAVCYVVEQGLFNGTTTTTFEPNSPMNRAMLATVLYRVEGAACGCRHQSL